MLFEDKTYEKLLQTCIDKAPKGIDTKQGSIFYDACAAKCLLLAEIYADLEMVSKGCRIETALGYELDACGADFRIDRIKAIPMKCKGLFIGVEPKVGSRFFSNGIYFILKDDLEQLYPNDEELLSEGNLYLEAELSGVDANSVKEGDELVPCIDVEGLERATIGKIIVYGSDEEDDESYRGRIKNKLHGPSENGNKNHYKEWCESCVGVGYARILPLVNVVDGDIRTRVPNYVTGVLLTDEGRSVSDATVELVQEYIDPEQMGLGEGVANMGAHFVAVKAKEVKLFVSADIELSEGYSSLDVEEEISQWMIKYLKELSLQKVTMTNGLPDEIIIRIKQIGAMLSKSDKIIDYDNLQICLEDEDFDTSNISISALCVAVLGQIDLRPTKLV